MTLKIVDACVSCFACMSVCPTEAISQSPQHFEIASSKCTECDGYWADPQLASICPIEGAILDSIGVAMNPPGSLTGIPPERLAEVQAELQSH